MSHRNSIQSAIAAVEFKVSAYTGKAASYDESVKALTARVEAAERYCLSFHRRLNKVEAARTAALSAPSVPDVKPPVSVLKVPDVKAPVD